MLNKFSFLIYFLLLPSLTFSQETHQIVKEDDFAQFLVNSQLYEFAAEEYERLLFLNPSQEKYLTQLVKCYQKSGQAHLLSIRLNSIDKPNKEKVLNRINLMLISNQEDKVMEFGKKHRHFFSTNEFEEIKFRSALSRKSWIEANEIYKEQNFTKDYSKTIKSIQNPRYKNPNLAAIMSAVVPSSGRMYAKDFKDGLLSLLFIGTSGFQSYRRFKKSGIESAGGWIYGGIALGFYVSNIYGSFQAAKFYNKKIDDRLYEMVYPDIVTDQ